jgi:hypothetical protein
VNGIQSGTQRGPVTLGVGKVAAEEHQLYRPVVGRAPKLGLVVAFVVLAISACGRGDSGAAGGGEAGEEQAKARTVPEYGDLRPGKYTTDEFEPAFSFEVVGQGWVVGGYEERGILDMRQGSGGPVLSFVNEQKVFDPSQPRDLVSVSVPEDMVAWLQQHPYLQTYEPQPATVGGVEGVQFDAMVADVPASEFGETCLGLFEVSLEVP